MIKYFILSCITLCSFTCEYYDHQFPYNFEKPEKIINVSGNLNEISGLHYAGNGNLYAVHDEEGEIFEINPNTGENKKILDFKENGDFEGITKVGNYFYVLKSDGDVYKVDGSGNSSKATFFDEDDDFEFEGICRKSNSPDLLIACKKHGKKDLSDLIWIYEYSTLDEEYSEKPFIVINKKGVHENFRASGISMNHLGNIFILSAASFTLAEFDIDGNLVNIAQLPFLMFPQAEGICFDKMGSLFIASEKANQDHGKIIKISRHEN